MSQRFVLKLSRKIRSHKIDKRHLFSTIKRVTFLGLVMIGLLAQSFGFVAFAPSSFVAAASSATTSPSNPQNSLRNPKLAVVPIMQEQPSAGPVNLPTSPKVRPADITTNLTLYAYKTSDDAGTTALANCTNSSAASNCSLRSAITLAANHNPSASSAVTILTITGATYTVTKALPVVPSFTLITPNTTPACPTPTGTLSTLSIVQPASGLAGVKGFTLTGSNSTINGLAVVGFPSDGIFISGSNNTVSCSEISNNGNSGIVVRGGKAIGNIIKNNIIGVTANATTAAYNGNSSGAGVQCNPSDQVSVSQDCNGIFLAGDVNGPVQNTTITGNTIAANGPQSVATGIMIDNGNNNTIQNNYIGTNQSLTASFTTFVDIYVLDNSSGNAIGGDNSQYQGNVIGSFFGIGIAIFASDINEKSVSSTNNNIVRANAVGVDLNGNTNANLTPKSDPDYPDFPIGIDVNASNTANTLVNTVVGGSSANYANLVGNSKYGIYVTGQGATNTQISGNWVGKSRNSSGSAGNQNGIFLNASGPATIANNIVNAANLSSSQTVGIELSGYVISSQITGNDVESNTQGILLTGGPNQDTIKNNVVANNQTGIQIGANSSDSNTKRDTISQNSIYGNTSAGINLNYPSGNGTGGGADSGPNNQAAPPIITSVTNSSANVLTVSGTASSNSIVEIFQGDASGGSMQGRVYLGSTTATANGNFTASNLATNSLASNAVLVATSTLNDPAASQRVGSTSAFSSPYPLDLSVAPDELNFKILTSTTTASQNFTLSTQQSSANYTTSISYGAGPSGWLAVTPSSGSVSSSSPVNATATVTNTNLPVGVYTAAVTFTDSTTSVTLNVQLTVSGTGYTYYLPFLANNANSFTTYLAMQNTGSAAANVSLTYFDSNGITLTSSSVITQVNQNGESIPTNPFASGQSGTGVITSDQPLNVIVPEATPYGGSAYAISSGGASSLIAPLAINGAFGGYFTQLTVFNGGDTSSNITVNFYNQDGSTAPAASTQTFSLNPHTSRTFAQNDSNSGLPSGFSGWAQITGSAGSQLTAQVLEQNPSQHFVAIANAQPVPFGQSTLYAPAIFNQAFGSFVTGVNIVNPTANNTVVKITYFDNSGNSVGAPTTQILAAHAVLSVFQPATQYLGSGFYGSAEIDGNDLVMVVNENGGLTASGSAESGVYNAIASGGGNVSLPVMSNGGFGYITGATVLNAGSTSQNITITYYDISGKSQGQNTYTIPPHASQPIYQGGTTLPSGFYGTAQVTSNPSANLLVTTNAISPAFFYTYTEPAS